MGAVQGSSLYAGSVSKQAIYEISQGSGFQWGSYLYTEINVDGLPRQLTRAEHAGNPIQANIANPRDADFAATSAITIDGRQLSVVELMVINDFTTTDWKDTFPEYQPSGLNIDLKINPMIQKVVFDLAMEATKSQINEIHAIGDTALIAPDPMRWYDGFTTLILADVDATQVGVPAVLTSVNILAQVQGLIQAVPGRLRNKTNLVTFCSIADYDLYNAARAITQTYIPQTDVAGSPALLQSFGQRINLVPIDGMPKDFMFTTLASSDASSNLVQGVWAASDEDTLKLYRSEEADQTWKILLRFDMGIQYKSGKDIFFINAI